MSVSGSATTLGGTVLPFPEGVLPSTTLQDLGRLLLEQGGDDDVLFCTLAAIPAGADERVVLEGDRPLCEMPGFDAAQNTVELTVVKERTEGAVPMSKIAACARPLPDITSVTAQFDADVALANLVEKLPNLTEACFKIGGNQPQPGKPASFWSPLGRLQHLEKLSIDSHHGHRSSGEFHNQVLEAMLHWGDEGPKLREFVLRGAMSLDLRFLERFVDEVQCLAPDLRTFSVEYWYANPPQINTRTLMKITKRWRQLKFLKVGSCCHRVTDEAFKYFMDNDEGIQAGLELETLELTCITTVTGQGWLEVDNVKRNLPKLRKIFVGAGRQFCQCGAAACGSSAHLLAPLRDECGIEFVQSAAHW